jgi:hypothetical protein
MTRRSSLARFDKAGYFATQEKEDAGRSAKNSISVSLPPGEFLAMLIRRESDKKGAGNLPTPFVVVVSLIRGRLEFQDQV